MEEKNYELDCHIKCRLALEELKNTYSHIEQLHVCGRPEQTTIYLDNISTKFDPSLICDCCTIIDYTLLLLTLISTSFTKLETLKKQDRPAVVECSTENSTRDLITGLRRMLTEKSTILFIVQSLRHSSKFVTYKASKLMLRYFEELPCILAGEIDSIWIVIHECMKNNSAMVLRLIHDAMKSFRKKLQRMALELKMVVESDASGQLTILVNLLRICNDTLAEKYYDPCDCPECKNPPCILRVKTMYQAEKLRNYILQAIGGNRSDKKGSCLFQPEQLKECLECLKSFLAMFSFDWKTFFEEAKLDSYAVLYKLKLLLSKMEVDIYLNADINLQAVEFLNHFVQNSHIMEHFDYMKSYGFGGSSIAAPLDNNSHIAKEYTQPTRSLKLLVLVLLKSFLYALHLDGSSSLQATLELGNRALNSLSKMLECASSRCTWCSLEQVSEKFCGLLVEVMMDDDDQLIRSVEALLFIYGQASKHFSHYEIEDDKERILNKDFPHILVHCLLDEIAFDHIVCIDWLISDETCFASVLYHYLDIVMSDFKSFLQSLSQIGILKNNGLLRSCNYSRDYIPERGLNEVATQGLLTRKAACFRAHANYITSCVDGTPSASNIRVPHALELSTIDQKSSTNETMESGFESELAVNEHLSGDEMQVNYPVTCQQDVLSGNGGAQDGKNDVAIVPSLVVYSSSDTDDDFGDEEFNVSQLGTFDDDENIGEKHACNMKRVFCIDCEKEPCSCAETRDQLLRSSTAFQGKLDPCSGEEMKHLVSDASSLVSISNWDGTKEKVFVNSTGTGQGCLSEQVNLCNNKTIEIFMDFLIRLKLKLERICVNSLSRKDFKGLISQLDSIESMYDSLVSDE